jgi:NADPH-dependent 2,4-dienoyl-CoA reductase/sulfur reductase-like enzyme/ferredoxin
MPTLTIDGAEVTVEPGATLLEAARRLGIDIPTLCYREGCAPETSCMVCLVRVNGGARLVPSCATVAVKGMRVESETEEVHAARRTALELLLGDHLGDCVGPCQSVCPAHLDIPAMIEAIAGERMAAAVALVRQRIPIPAILGRICPELCEKGCRRGRLDSPVAIRLLKRYVGDFALSHPDAHVPVCGAPTGHRVAIVGAGPAGLAAAYYLSLKGHACTLFDDHAEPGGALLHDGVPASALPRDVAAAEIATVVAVGIELRMNVRVGVDVSLEQLQADCDVVLIAVGPVEDAAEKAGLPGLGLQLSGRGIAADHHTQMTETPGVFVAGSALSPSRHAVRAVGSGYGAAQAIGRYLAGQPVSAAHRPYTVAMGRVEGAELETFAGGCPRHARLAPAGGETTGYVNSEAQDEATRCLRCDCAGSAKCLLRAQAVRCAAHPTQHRTGRRTYEVERSHPLVTFESGKCISCGLCIQIAGRYRDRLGLAFIGRGFAVRVGVPFGETIAEGLGSAARECALACPTGALARSRQPIADLVALPEDSPQA